jgi:hypothetical protein
MADLQRWLLELRAADAVLADERMDARAARRVARRLAATAQGHRAWWSPYVPAVSFAAGAVLVLIVLAWQSHWRMLAEQTGDRSQSELSTAPSCPENATPGHATIDPPLPPAEPPRQSSSPIEPAPAKAPAKSSPQRGAPRRSSVAVPEPPTPAPSVDPIDALLAELRALRRAGRYLEAERRLVRALADPWPARAREVLHYELGTIVERHTGDAARACALWRTHLEQFPRTRYAAAIADARRRLGCD